MKKWVIYGGLIFLSFGCCRNVTTVKEVPVDAKQRKLSEKILIEAGRLKFQERLVLEDSWLSDRGGKTRLHLKFSSMDIKNLNEARALLVEVADKYWEVLGLSAEELVIEMHFESFYVKYVDPYAVKRVHLRNGLVTYYASDAEDCDLDCKHLRTESFLQSRLIVSAIQKGEAPYKKERKREPVSVFTFE